jgi:hypothetical protein
MKNKIINIGLLIFFILTVVSCKREAEQDKMTQQKKPKIFSSLDEASKNAKSDLQEILKLDKDIKLNIDPKELEQSSPEGSVKHYMVDFKKLTSKDSLKSLKDISADEGITIVPFVYNKRVIAAASINKVQSGWSVGGLFNNRITGDIDKIKKIQQKMPNAEINYFEVPNIDAHVYQVSADTSIRFFADYSNVFSVEKEVNFQELAAVLKKDAAEFQRKFGKDLIDGKKLVK